MLLTFQVRRKDRSLQKVYETRSETMFVLIPVYIHRYIRVAVSNAVSRVIFCYIYRK